MRLLLIAIPAFFLLSCDKATTETKVQPTYQLSVNPSVDTSLFENQAIIQAVEGFLSSKNENATDNAYWEASDFQKYPFPYFDIYQIEKGRNGDYTYLPTLLEILPTDIENEQKVKIAFLGSPDSTAVYLKAIYNLIVIQQEQKITFKRILDHNTQNWPVFEKGSITYHVSPLKKFNSEEAARQEIFVEKLSRFFDISPIPLHYYSCTSPEELFLIRGFDYYHPMYQSKMGGQNEVWSGIIYSGNNAENYPHEIVHSYLYERYGQGIHRLLEEGMAMYLGGSVQLPYQRHRKNLKQYLTDHPDVDLSHYLDPYDQQTISRDETSLPYMVGALICERAFRMGGKKELLTLFEADKKETEWWSVLQGLGLNPENFHQQLSGMLQNDPILIFE